MIGGWRSLLFVPGDDTKRLAKAHLRGADAIIVDLEDGVGVASKNSARESFAWTSAVFRKANCPVVVRINGSWLAAMTDLAAVIGHDVDAVMVPKAEDPCKLKVLSQIIGEIERARGLPPGRIGLIALVETPEALRRLDEIATAERLIGLAFGSEDFCLELGVPPTPASLEWPCRQIALAAASRRLMALGLPISITEFRDMAALGEAARLGAAIGLTGALCIHPAQIAVVNAAFSPSPASLAEARAIVSTWAAAQADGQSVTAFNGRMIDRPVYERAARTIRAADNGRMNS